MSTHSAMLRKLQQKQLTMLNFGSPQFKIKEVIELAKSELGALHLTTNLGVQGWEKKLKFDLLGYPDMTVNKFIKPWTKLKGFAFHSLFKMKEKGDFAAMWRQVEESVPAGPRLGIHLRVGDVSWRTGDGDRRQVIFNSKWGLKSPTEAAKQSVECAQQLAKQIGFTSPCAIIFESDNADAKKCSRQASQQSGPCLAWSSSMAPKHSAMLGGSNRAGGREGMETWLAMYFLVLLI